jgi:hypothetical protein
MSVRNQITCRQGADFSDKGVVSHSIDKKEREQVKL